MKYAITAATGNFGQTAVKELLKLVDAKDVVVVARNLEKAQELFPEVEIRQGSYDSVESMTNALLELTVFSLFLLNLVVKFLGTFKT